MNTEQLRMILEAIEKAGEGAKEVLYFFLGKEVLADVLIFLGVIIGITCVYRLINFAIRTHAFGSRVCSMFGLDIARASHKSSTLNMLQEARSRYFKYDKSHKEYFLTKEK